MDRIEIDKGRMADQNFPKSVRLRTSADFARVYNANVYAADDCLVMQGRKNDLSEKAGVCNTRIGLSVSRKVGNAVVRNKWKRLIREAFRIQKFDFPPCIDLVVRPKKGAQPEFHLIKKSLLELAERIARKLGNPESAARKR